MLLKVEHLRISFGGADGKRETVPVRDVSFSVGERTSVALVGESGCGKSLTALALGGLVDRARIGGRIEGAPRIAYVFQNPIASFDPVMRIGRQIDEAAPGGKVSEKEMAELLKAVGLPLEIARRYPCQMSGGQCQRAMIACALASQPQLLIADEPTTALDVLNQREALDLIEREAARRGMSVLLITHNLGLVARYAREVNVMYAGTIVESGQTSAVLRNPRHPYTRGLLAAVPRLSAPRGAPLRDIPGTVPPPDAWPEGCAFHPRCPYARPGCSRPDFAGCPEMQRR